MGTQDFVSPAVVARSSRFLFAFIWLTLIVTMLQALSWAGASPFAYGAGLADWLAFLLASLAITVVVFRALRNVKLFADREVVGRVDFMGGTTICPRSELAEIRVVWRWILPSRGSFAHWGAPVLHVRRRDMTELS